MAGEIVKAKASLKDLTTRILAAAKDLGSLEERIELKKTEEGEIDSRLSSKHSEEQLIDLRIQEKRAELQRLDTEKGDKILMLIGIDSSREKSAEVLAQNEIIASDLSEDIASLEDRKASAEESAEYSVLRAQERGADLDEAEKQLRVFQAQEAHVKASIVQKSIRLQRILGAIEDAMTAFRLYERRIARFAKDTGYLVSYTDPLEAADNQ